MMMIEAPRTHKLGNRALLCVDHDFFGKGMIRRSVVRSTPRGTHKFNYHSQLGRTTERLRLGLMTKQLPSRFAVVTARCSALLSRRKYLH